MEMRSFGDGVSVSVLGVGCSRLGSVSNPAPMREIEAMLEAAVDGGVNLFDTADIYGQGDSERTLGRLLRRRREATVRRHQGRGPPWPVRGGDPTGEAAAEAGCALAFQRARRGRRWPAAAVVRESSPSDLRLAVDASRRRLGLDRLDGLLLHSPSVETLRAPEIHAFLDEVLRDGKAARVGGLGGTGRCVGGRC